MVGLEKNIGEASLSEFVTGIKYTEYSKAERRPMKKIIYLAIVSSCVFQVGSLSAQNQPLDFARDIRPIFSNKCFVCHGPDSNTRQGGFRLDVCSSAFAEADSGMHPIVAGNVSKSELVKRILDHGDDKMPPPDSEISLTEDEVVKIVRWVGEGATWAEHWAFVSPSKPEIPEVKDQNWITNELDYLVLAKLEKNGLTPNKSASRETLIRRLSLDLVGLPPTIEQVDEFLNDGSDDAYEKLVERLLSSPHYGEHFASGWLDAARFADTNGYQNDFKRSMWVWRDWLIDALNQNMPYDQFVIEQIAGDLIPDATTDQIIATGFNRNHRTVTEGGAIEEEWHVENLVDRVETTSTVFLGLTMGCARCHDHKYDPISQKEFYQFFAFFNSVDEKGFHNERRGNVPPLIQVPTQQYQQDVANAEDEVQQTQDQLAKARKSFNKPGPEKVDRIKQSKVVRAVEPKKTFDDAAGAGSLFSSNTYVLEKENHKPVDMGNAYEFQRDEPFSVTAWVKPSKFGAILSRMNVDNDYRGFDMLLNDNGTLSVHFVHKWYNNAIKITTKNPIQKDKWTHVAVTYDGSSKAKGFEVYFAAKRQPTRVNHDGLKSSTLTENPLLIGLRNRTPGFAGEIANLSIYDSDLDEDSVVTNAKAELRLRVRMKDDNAPIWDEVANQWLILNDEKYFEDYHSLESKIEKLRRIKKSVPTVMVMKEAKTPRPTYVLERGQYDKPIKDEEIQPGFPSALPIPEMPEERMGRMDLANWLVDRQNPLTARVAVNRIWSKLFGVGIHRTVEDFGVQSPQPSNQDLLDYLAVDFMESGWDVKKLIKKIVTSSTYRQSSSIASESFELDPGNEKLTRGSRFRLSAEAVRDNALAISGLLVRQIGGPSIKPYQPEGLWEDLAGGAGEGKYVMDRDENLYRRSLYIYRKRTVPHPTMSTFDASSREVCQVTHQRTNTPLQALALLNDDTYVEAARHLAIKAKRHSTNLDAQIVYAFRAATARRPSPDEIGILRSSYNKAKTHFDSDENAALALLSVGVSKPLTAEIDSQLAALSTICSMILNLDETITRE